jgi:hypothetical protein
MKKFFIAPDSLTCARRCPAALALRPARKLSTAEARDLTGALALATALCAFAVELTSVSANSPRPARRMS